MKNFEVNFMFILLQYVSLGDDKTGQNLGDDSPPCALATRTMAPIASSAVYSSASIIVEVITGTYARPDCEIRTDIC